MKTPQDTQKTTQQDGVPLRAKAARTASGSQIKAKAPVEKTAPKSAPRKGAARKDGSAVLKSSAKSGPKSEPRRPAPKPQGRLSHIHAAAEIYGLRSFDNYAQIRSVAERLRDGLCQYLDGGHAPCVFLVPPQGAFASQNYGSAAFSVSGQGFLPLEPMSFGLAIRVSEDEDYMRLVISCRKEGPRLYLQIEDGMTLELILPLLDSELERAYEALYTYLRDWFERRVARYDHGSYGGSDIGFDIVRARPE